MTIIDFASIIVAIAVVVAAVFLVTAVNNLNNTLAKLEETASHLRSEGVAAFTELRQLIADADAELDKVDIVLDRADQATTAISETTRRTHEAVQDPVIRTLAVASGTGRVARKLLRGRKSQGRTATGQETINLSDSSPSGGGRRDAALPEGGSRRGRRKS